LSADAVTRLTDLLPEFADATRRLTRPARGAPDEQRLTKWDDVKAHRTPAEVERWLSLEGELIAEGYNWFKEWIHCRSARHPLRDDGSTTFVANELFLKLRREFLHGRIPPTAEEFVASISANIGRVIRNLNTTARSHRRVRPIPALADDDEPFDTADAGPPPDTEAEFLDLLAAIYRRLAHLSEEYQTAFQLRFVAGMTLREIAAHLGISHDKVERRLRRVREVLAAFDDGPPADVTDLPAPG